MRKPGSSAVGEEGGGGRNWLSPQWDRGFKVKIGTGSSARQYKVEIETSFFEMWSNLKLYK